MNKGRSEFNTRKNFNSSAQTSGSGSFYETPEVTKNFNDRLDYLLVNSIGSTVVVTSTSGIQFEGVLSACNLESTNGIDVILKNAKIVDNGITKEVKDLTDKVEETLLIQGDDVAEIDLKNIDFNLEEKWENNKKLEEEKKQEEEKKKADAAAAAAAAKSSAGTTSRSPSNAPAEGKKAFQTDVDISRSREIKQRELQKWTPDDNETFNLGSGALEDENEKWDQFAVNEKKFGIKSSFDEHFYTTKINKNDPNYAERVKEADRIAKEIESQGTSGNVHIAEDRGIIIDDSGMDEEDLYSGVDRRGDELLASLKTNSKPVAPKPRKYVPPTLRNQPHHMDPAILSSTGTKVASPVTKHSAGLSSKKESKQKKQPNSKEAQIEELRKFSEKFKVPYEMPKDMQDLKKTSSPAPTSQSSTTTSTQQTHKESPPKSSIETPSRKSSTEQTPAHQTPSDNVPAQTPTKRSGSNLKADPSLPPKPVNKTPGAKVSLPPTPSTSKTELKKGPVATASSTASPQHMNQNMSPGLARPTSSRRRNAGSFFGNKKILPKEDVKEKFARNFNMFLKSKEAFDKKQAEKAKAATEDKENKDGSTTPATSSATPAVEQFFIEKPYFTAPTWTSTVEKSYKDFFPDGRTAMQRAQARLQKRQMGGMGAGGMMGSHAPGGVMSPHMGMGMGAGGMGRGNMGGFPMAPMAAGGGAPAMMNGFGGMYMPFQPQPVFYPGMVPMMGGAAGGSAATGAAATGAAGRGTDEPSGSMSPQTMSPHMPPAYMGGAPMGYPPPGAPFHGMMGGMNDRGHGNHYNNHRNHHNNYHHQK